MVKAVIVQRVVPHYRVPLFEELHRRLGWRVACSQGGPDDGLNLADPAQHEWLIPVPFQRSRRNPYRARTSLSTILRLTQPEALVCEFSLQLTIVWRLALLGSPVPFAFWSQGWNRDRGFDTALDRSVQQLRLALLRRAHAQLAYSEESAQYLTERLGSDMPVFVARNTLAMETMPGRDIDTSPRDPAVPHLVSIGRLKPEKHMPRVIEAFCMVRDAHPGARLTVIGDGPDRPAVEAAAAASQGSVTLLGEVYDEEAIARVLQGASLLVIGGSVGLSVNHALAYGVPVMIFDDKDANRHHPEHSYVIDGVTGFRVKDSGTAGLAAAMRDALAAPGPRAKLGERLRDHVASELSLERMIEGFVGLDAQFAALRR